MSGRVDTGEAVGRFKAAAEQYCAWVEGPADSDVDATTAVRLLATLIHLVQEMPDAEAEDVPGHDKHFTVDDWKAISRRFASLPFQYYKQFWKPFDAAAGDPVVGDIADDLTDVYLDLKEGLRCLAEGYASQAVFHWRFMFEVHWGRHATSALHVLHCYLTDPERPTP